MNETDCIVLDQINKKFGSRHVLTNVSLCVSRGSIYGLLGPSGCGKTTTVKIMAGISEATSGSAYLLGEKMPQLDIMKHVGYMAQSDALYDALSAAENMAFFAALYGMSKKEIRQRISETAALVNLSADLHRPVRTYSGGMKRRLSLAVSILHQPEILILDEPTVGIDPLLRRNIWDELNRMTAQGVTIVITTHVMDEAERCHQLAMMRNGSIIAQGTPQALQQQIGAASIEEAFLYYGGDDHED